MNVAFDALLTAAFKLRAARDTLRTFYGDAYPAKIAGWRQAVRAVADERHHGNSLAAAVEICKDPEIAGNGYAMLVVLAAACDESEVER